MNNKRGLLVTLVVAFIWLPNTAYAKQDQVPSGKVLIINASHTNVIFYLRKDQSQKWSKVTLMADSDNLYPYETSGQILILTAGIGTVIHNLKDGERYQIYVAQNHQFQLRRLILKQTR